MPGLNGVRIALLEGRMPSELANLVRRHGGEPYCVPAVREQPVEAGAQVATFIDDLVAGNLTVVVCLTGAVVKLLFQEAERLGRLSELLAALQDVTVVCRGPKPAAVLRQNGVAISLSARSPYTTQELLEVMASLELTDAGVALLHYGERNAALAATLQTRGARLEELLLYEWQLPADLDGLQCLVDEVLSRQMDAIAFTSQIQIRHLFQVAADLGKTMELTHALNTSVIVAAVGPVCAAVLHDMGISPDVVPEHPKMGAMVSALVRFIERNEKNLVR